MGFCRIVNAGMEPSTHQSLGGVEPFRPLGCGRHGQCLLRYISEYIIDLIPARNVSQGGPRSQAGMIPLARVAARKLHTARMNPASR